MGEGTGRLEASPHGRSAERVSPGEAARRLEADIAGIREQLGGLVGELDRRRHEMLDVKLQARRHAVGVAVTAAALVGAATAVVWLRMRPARRRRRAPWRATRLRDAVGRMVRPPDRVAAKDSALGRIMTAAATTAVATLVNRILGRAVDTFIDRHEQRDERRGPHVRGERARVA